MDVRMQPVIGILNLNAALFRRALEGVDQASAEKRPNGKTNSLAFIACHALDARFYLMRMCGHEMTNPWQEMFDATSDIEELEHLPPVYELATVWDELHDASLNHLRDMTAADLDADAPTRFPTDDPSLLGAIAFLSFHEAYHVGQMGLVRKFLGFPPVVQR